MECVGNDKVENCRNYVTESCIKTEFNLICPLNSESSQKMTQIYDVFYVTYYACNAGFLRVTLSIGSFSVKLHISYCML